MIGLLFTACKKEEKKSDGYVITGDAKGVYNGIRIYLRSADERGNQTPQDTAIVMNETFKFEGKVDYPQMWYISVNNIGGFVPIMVENETMHIDLNKEDLNATKITGTKANEALTKYTKGYKNLMEERSDVDRTLQTNQNPLDSIDQAKATKDLADYSKRLSEYPYEFLENNTDSYFSLSLMENILKSKPADVAPLEKAFANLDSEIRNSLYGGIVEGQINAIKQQNERLSMLDIGKVAPDFSAPNPEGKQVSLNDIKGKATIIDFWAAWCGPCRRENPNVVKVYEKYHDKGLEIISVSLDRPGQKDKWLKAIEDDKLTWHHVSNLQYFNDPVAQQYNIQSIPATFILDADGKIVAKSLRGQALEDQIARMLN